MLVHEEHMDLKVLPWGRAPCCLPAKHGSGQGDVSPQVLLCSPNR